MIMGYIRRHGRLSEESAIGMGYVAAMALVTIFLGLRTALTSMYLGTSLAISWD
jgi:hypothetical protein